MRGRDIEVRCHCGAVHGRVENVSRDSVMRAVCYCDDCQAFLHHLGRAELLDEHGGSDVVQVSPASLTFDRGEEKIVGVRLAPKGLYRWYASCCKTPLGNTLSPSVPFVGILIHSLSGTPSELDDTCGKSRGSVRPEYGIGALPRSSTPQNLLLLARAVRRILGWRLGGHTWPHPFFDRTTRLPSRPVAVLSPEEREALRPLCGPHPSVQVPAH